MCGKCCNMLEWVRICWNAGVCCSDGMCWSLLEYVGMCWCVCALETLEALAAKVVKVSNHSVPT